MELDLGQPATIARLRHPAGLVEIDTYGRADEDGPEILLHTLAEPWPS